MENDIIHPDDDEPKYDLTPEQATSLEGSGGSAGLFNRKRVMILLCVVLAVTVAGGVMLNTLKSSKKSNTNINDELAQSRSNAEFLSSLQNSALRDANRNNTASFIPENISFIVEEEQQESLFPTVSFERQYNEPPQPTYQPSYQQQRPDTFYQSSLVPQVQGSLFGNNPSQGASSGGQNFQSYTPANAYSTSQYDDYLNSLNAMASSYGNLIPSQGQAVAQQNNNQEFYESTSSSGAVYGGQFLGDDSIWTGTVIPGVLETAINTDLPGQVLARVTQNIYDTKTGRHLLIPQGSILIARYNSSVSYAQNRIQIIWDTLIRPDGYQVNLEGANGVDRAGMSGQEANYHGNFFEYVKAAGIITLFSIANGKLTETIDKYSNSPTTAGAVAEGNAQFFGELGAGLVNQAMNISPTLTVDNGTLINIMLNKTIYLPRISGYQPTQKYILE